MAFHHAGDIRYFTFDSFDSDIVQAVFTRKGGFSPAPWDSLNVGGTVGDERERVISNRLRSFQAMGRDPASIFDVWQVHSADVVCAQAPRPIDQPYTKADVILTDRPEVTLFMRFADCVPVLLHDPVRKVVGLVHAGWMGTVKGAVRSAVEQMVRTYGTQPQDVVAGIGPSIGPDHYEIGPEVVSRVRDAFGDEASRLLQSSSGRVYFDLWAANETQLKQSGVQKIEISALCTACHLEDWFSHRAEKGRTGRFGALVALSS